MKKVISTLFLCLSVCLGARAQVFIINDDVFRGRMSDIKATVLDSLTNEPVAFASVYVVPSKDTTITNFTLTDAKGEAKLDEVPFGSYVFHVEMMGYKPFVKEKYFRNEDMGTIRLQVDQQFLQAATVTDVGNPIVVKKDTVEFNASSFRVGANAMLKDLLKRMPGMEITEDGKVKNTYIEDDGSVSVGDYDLVPIVDTFVEQHPDFSYHGHKGVLALTGYEGVLGYRTDEVYKTREEGRVTEYQRAFFEANPDFDFDREVADAKAVADAMKAEGWEFASHTWGHINPRQYTIEQVQRDSQRWHDWVVPVVGETDILIFAFGADIGDWQPYTYDNEYYAHYKSMGFNFYCNVDSSVKAWVQVGPDFLRQGRRNLDGYRMYYSPELISDLYDVETAWDSNRPTPVPQM